MVLAPIERLPVELLQPIFIAAGHSIALIEASTYIAARLSSEYIYHSTCNYYLTDQMDDMVFLQVLDHATVMVSLDVSVDGRRKKAASMRSGRRTLKILRRCCSYRRSITYLELSIVKGRIPKKLLSGPWTRDKIEFLRFLLWITAMTVDWMNPETAQVAIDGRKQAMLDRNLEAVELFNHNRRLGRPADLGTVLFAVMHAGCDRSIVYDTLLAANMWYGRKTAQNVLPSFTSGASLG
ncbi:unnamed protein product [Alternaria alternata]